MSRKTIRSHIEDKINKGLDLSYLIFCPVAQKTVKFTQHYDIRANWNSSILETRKIPTEFRCTAMTDDSSCTADGCPVRRKIIGKPED